MRRSIIPALAIAGSMALIAAAPPGFTEGDQTFYLRGEGCGATEQPYLSVNSGPDGLDGCGGIGGAPFNEVFHQVFGEDRTDFVSIDGLPVVIDATRNITGQIRAEQWADGTASVGQVIVEGTITGRQGSKTVTLATFSEEAFVANVGPVTGSGVDIPLDIDIPDSVTTAEFSSITVSVAVRGLNQNNSNLGLEGDSFIELPILLEDEATAATES